MKHRVGTVMLALLAVAGAVVVSGSQAALAGPTIEYGDGGYMTIGIETQLRYAYRDTGAGPEGDQSIHDFYFRRNRLLIRGAVDQTWGYYFQIEHLGDQRILDYPTLSVSQPPTPETLNIIDAYITARASGAFQFRAGRTKNVSSREVLETCYDPLSADRSLFINTGTFNGKRTRDYGVTMWGNLVNDMVQYRVALMDGNESAPSRNYRYTGRLHVTLLDPENGFGYFGTYLGTKKVLTAGASYDFQPNAVYSHGTTGSEDYKAYSFDVFFEYPTDFGTFTVSGAYLKSDFGDAGTRGIADASGLDGEKNGSYWKAGYMIGKFQVFGRYEDWSFAELQGIIDQNIKWTAFGVNYYIKGQDLRVTLEYSINDYEKTNADNKDFKTAVLQLQARF